MTTKVLGIDLRDAGRDGVYRVDPDDPVTLIGDAQPRRSIRVTISPARCASPISVTGSSGSTRYTPSRPASRRSIPSTLVVIAFSVGG